MLKSRQNKRNSTLFFPYAQSDLLYLQRRDKKLGAIIDAIGPIRRPINPEPFVALISSVVGQQISSKAAATVWQRLCQLLPEMSWQAIEQTDVMAIQQCGLSLRKAGYIKGIAQAAAAMDFAALGRMADGDIIKALSALPGVGVWTVEMLLIFSFCRPNVLSWSDLAIRRGMMSLYGLKELDKDKFARYYKRYSPHASLASLYLWEMSHL